MTLTNCKNYGTITGYNASAMVGMTGSNSTRYTVSGLENYGTINYVNSGNLFTYGSHTLNSSVTEGSGSALNKLSGPSISIDSLNHLVINEADPAYTYRVTMSVPTQEYNYNNSGNWSGAFPWALIKTYDSEAISNETIDTVTYHGIFGSSASGFDLAKEDLTYILEKNTNGIFSLVSYNGHTFYYMDDGYTPSYKGLVTTSNGAESGNLSGTITVTLTVETLVNGVSAGSSQITYQFDIQAAAYLFDQTT